MSVETKRYNNVIRAHAKIPSRDRREDEESGDNQHVIPHARSSLCTPHHAQTRRALVHHRARRHEEGRRRQPASGTHASGRRTISLARHRHTRSERRSWPWYRTLTRARSCGEPVLLWTLGPWPASRSLLFRVVRVCRRGVAANLLGRRGLCPTPCILLAVRLAVDLKVPVSQRPAAVEAAEASNVVLGRCLVFHVVALDTSVASPTEATVKLMVMLLAIGLVTQHIELGRREGLRACGANETGLVVLSRQPPVRRRDAFAFDGQATGLAVASVRRIHGIA